MGIGGAILAVASMIFGFFLGISALSDIRQSDGQKRGLSRSTFAVLTWPVLVLMAIISMFIPGPMETKFFSLILLISFGVICWSLVPTLRRWARNEQSLSPLFIRSSAIIAIPVLITFGAVDGLTSALNFGEFQTPPTAKSYSSSDDPQTRELAGKLEAAFQLPSTSQKSLTIAALAEEVALAGKPQLTEQACQRISIDSTRNTTRYRCALILGRQGMTLDASAIAGKISISSLKRTALLKIANGEFDDNSIPPPTE